MKKLITILFLIFQFAGSGQMMLQSAFYSSSAAAACDTIITQDTTITPGGNDTLFMYDNLIAWYEMEDVSSIVDSSVNSLDGTNTNVTEQVTGIDGFSFDYNGTTSGSEIADNDLLSFNQAFTVSAWVQLDAGGTLYQPIVLKGSEYWCTIYNNVAMFRIYDSGTTNYMGVFTTNNDITIDGSTWNHVTFAYDGSGIRTGMKIYVNGQAKTTTPQSLSSITGMSNTTSVLYVGRSGSSFLDGVMDKVRLWDYEMPPTQVDSMYNSGVDYGYDELITSVAADTTIIADTTYVDCPGESTPTPDPDPTGTFLTSADIYVGATTLNDTISLDSFNNRTLVLGEDTIGIVEDIEGTLVVSASGTSAVPLVIGAFGSGAQPKIYGSEVVTGTWTLHSGNIYKIPHSGSVNQVFEDGVKLTSARYPNTGYFDITSAGTVSYTSTQISSAIDYTGATSCVRTRSWYIATSTVSSSSGQTITLPSEPLYGLDNGEGFFLFDKLAFLDIAGEWYHSGDTLYVYTADGTTPSDNVIRASVTNSVIDVDGKSYVNIQNLSIQHANQYGVSINNSDFITLDSLNIDYADQIGVSISSSASSNCTVKECTVNYSSYYGYRSSGNNHLVTDNTIQNIGLITDLGVSGTEGQSGAGIYFRYGVTGNNTARYNTVKNVGYNGIWFWDSPSTLVEYNYVYGACLVTQDGGGIYCFESSTAGEDSDNSVIRYNIVDSVPGNLDGYTGTLLEGDGLYTDDRISNTRMDTNVVARVTHYGLYLHNNINVLARGNTIFNAASAYRPTSAYGATGNEIKNNIICNPSVANQFGAYAYLGMMNPTENAIVDINNNSYYDFHRASPFRRMDNFTNITFAAWKTATTEDASSTYDNTSLAVGEYEKLFYNASKTAAAQDLSGYTSVTDLDGTTVSSLTLQPYTGQILIVTD